MHEPDYLLSRLTMHTYNREKELKYMTFDVPLQR